MLGKSFDSFNAFFTSLVAAAIGLEPNQINLYSGKRLASSTKSTIPFLLLYIPIPTITLSSFL